MVKQKKEGGFGDYHWNTNEAKASFLLEEALSNSSWDWMQIQPASRLEITCARTKSTVAANPSLKAS